MADFHKKWKDYVLLVEQAPPVGPTTRQRIPRAPSQSTPPPGPTTRRRIPRDPVQPAPGLANLEKDPRGRISKFKGVTITFPDPDGPQTGAGKQMVTHTVTRVPSSAGDEGNWKSWDPSEKKEAMIALRTYARNLERRLNDPEFMKVMRETHPKESQDFAGLKNMMIENPREFEHRLNAIEAQIAAGPFDPMKGVPQGAVISKAREASTRIPPDFKSMDPSKEGAIEFGHKKYGVSERELQSIWDDEQRKLQQAYEDGDDIFAGAISMYGGYYDDDGNVNQKARQAIADKTTKEFQKKLMAITHAGAWSSEEIATFVDTGVTPERLGDEGAAGHDAGLRAINRGDTGLVDAAQYNAGRIMAGDPLGSDLKSAAVTPDGTTYGDDSIYRDFNMWDDDYLAAASDILTGEDAKHGWKGILPLANPMSTAGISDNDAADLRRRVASGLPTHGAKIPVARDPLTHGVLPAAAAAATIPFFGGLPYASTLANLGAFGAAGATGPLMSREVLGNEADVFERNPYWVGDNIYIPPPAEGEDFDPLVDVPVAKKGEKQIGIPRAVDKAKEEYAQGIRYKHDPSAPGLTAQHRISPEQHAAEVQADREKRAAQKAQQAAAMADAQRKAQGRSKTYRDYVPSFLRFESVDHASNEMIVEQIKKAIMKEFYQGSQSREGARMPINLFKQDRHITYNSDPFDVFSFEFEQAFNALVAKYNFAIEDENLHEPIFHEAGRVIQSFVDVDSIEREVLPQVYDENTTLDVIMSEFQNLFSELVATHAEDIEEENLGDDVYREALGLVKARLGLV